MTYTLLGFPGVSAVKNFCAMHKMEKTQFLPMDWENPSEKEMATPSSILAGKSYGQRSLVGYSPWDGKD